MIYVLAEPLLWASTPNWWSISGAVRKFGKWNETIGRETPYVRNGWRSLFAALMVIYWAAHDDAQILDRETGKSAFHQRLAHAFFDGRQIVGRNRAALDLVAVAAPFRAPAVRHAARLRQTGPRRRSASCGGSAPRALRVIVSRYGIAGGAVSSCRFQRVASSSSTIFRCNSPKPRTTVRRARAS